MESTTTGTDIQSLIGESVSPDYLHQEQTAELLAADDFEGYSEWSADLEEAAWDGAQDFNGVTVKKACEHSDCSHFRCEKNLRVGGIEI